MAEIWDELNNSPNTYIQDDDDDLDEDLDIQSKNDLDFNDFLNSADVILVDDAQTFDINQWEASIEEELE